MLSPSERTLLFDAIRPDPGYRLDHALITTYSLDLTALLSVPLALTFHDWHERDDGTPNVNPIGLLEALQSNADRLTVACQAGEIALPSSGRNLFAFLEEAVIEVSAPNGGVFHPKVWVLRYLPDAEGDPIRYRLLCASRNLTHDRSWDLLLALDGIVRPGERRVRDSAGVAQFVEGVQRLAQAGAPPLDQRRAEVLAEIAAEIARVQFEPPDGLGALRFHPIGFTAADPFAGRRDRMLIVSPFLGSSRLETLSCSERDVLISSQEELDRLADDPRERFDQVLILDPSTEAEPIDLEDDGAADAPKEADQRPESSADGALRGLHAKLYVADCGRESRIWIGSANATEAAFSRNIEFLVELEGRAARTGVASLIDDQPGGLRDLLRPYHRNEDLETDPDHQQAEQAADAAVHALGATRLELHILDILEGAPSAGRLALELHAPDGLPPQAEEVEVTAWPTTLTPDRKQPLAGRPAAKPRWEGLELAQVTAFLGLEVTARVGRAEVTRRVSVRCALVGAPGDRKGALVRAILSSPERLLRYLAFLLADLESDPAAALEVIGMLSQDGQPEAVADANPFAAEFPLLEGMVRALARDPGRLDRIAQLVAGLASTEEGRAILPDGFEAVWEPIWQAREQLRSGR